MIEPKWVSRKALEVLHGKSLPMFGGAPGLRDSGLLDSALARLEQVFVYTESTSLAALAAAYALGLCRNNPFVDGNKRAALLATLISLKSLAISEEELTGWIADRTRSISEKEPER